MKKSAALILVGCFPFVWPAAIAGCSADGTSGNAASGGASGVGMGGGGTSSGGSATQGGAPGTGGVVSGGTTSGGSTSGGSTSGGTTTGGSTSGGLASSGAPAGGAAGSGTGGSVSFGGNSGSGGSTAGNGGSAGSASGGAAGAAGWSCPAMSTLTGSPIPSGATPTRIAGAPPSDSFNMNNFTNVEGPVWIGDSLYFSEMKNSDIPLARILKVGASDAVSVFIDDSGSNGLAVDKQGNLLTANHGVGGIVRYKLSDKTKTTIVAEFGGKRFNSPNDLTARSDGTIYFTDPAYQNNARPQGSTLVYQVAPGASTATQIAPDYTSNPNGITLSLDEKSLFIAGSTGVKKYAIDATGTVSATGSAFAANNMNTDGMAIDCAGNLYISVASSTDILVVDASGTPVAGSPIKVTGPSAVTNLAFGGADRKTLYITGQGSSGQQGLFKVSLNFPGLPY